MTSLPNESTKQEDVAPLADSASENSAKVDSDFNPDWRFYMVFITLSILTLAAALDATSLSVAIPIISAALGGSAIEAFWAGTSFLLTSTVFQPIFASLSQIFGRKLALYVALAFFTVGAILAAVANGFTLMLVGRSLQGIGGGGLIVISEILVTDLVPLRLRGKWFGFLSSMWAIGSVSGPLVGGAFAQNVSWRWIFWINLPIIGVGAVFVTLFVKLNLVRGTIMDKLKRVNWIGTVLFIGSTTSILIPISWGGVSYAWDSWHTLVPLILGFAGIAAFIVYERFVAEPIMPATIFANWTLRLTYLQTVIHGMILWSLLYYLPLYYEAIQGYSPIVTGVAIFPETFTVAPASIAVGIAVSITGRYRWSLWSGWFLTILGSGLLYLMDVDTTIPQWIFLNLVVGLGTGILFPGMAFAIQAAVETKHIAIATAFFSFFRSFGQGLGIAIGGSIFQNQIKQKLSAYPLLAPMANQYSQDATVLVSVIQSMPIGEARDQLSQAYADSLKTIWIVMAALAAVAGIASLFVQHYSLDQLLVTEQGYNGAKKIADTETGVEKKEGESV